MNGQERQGQTLGELNGLQPEMPAGKNKKKKEKRPLGLEILSWILTLLAAAAAALVIRTVIFEPVRVDGASMNDTLENGEIMFVTKFDYSSTWLSLPWQSDEEKEAAKRFTLGGNPNRFDVVICRYPGRGDVNFVKRVIGLPGDTLELNNGILFVNDTQYAEAYVNDDYRTGSLNTFEAFTVPAKGDALTIRDTGDGYRLFLNDAEWNYRGMRNGITVTDADGKAMTVTGNGGIIYDGTTVTQDNAEEMLADLAKKTFTVQEDYFFVMGDHRNNSNDSRSQGPITRDMIIGHVRTVLFPFNKIRGVE